VANKAIPLPTFAQAGRFATGIGIKTPEAWAEFCKNKTRDDIFQQLLSWTNKRVIQIALEA
jgi:hypothetical protein